MHDDRLQLFIIYHIMYTVQLHFDFPYCTGTDLKDKETENDCYADANMIVINYLIKTNNY
jgi:hypothetical protein